MSGECFCLLSCFTPKAGGAPDHGRRQAQVPLQRGVHGLHLAPVEAAPHQRLRTTPGASQHALALALNFCHKDSRGSILSRSCSTVLSDRHAAPCFIFGALQRLNGKQAKVRL